MFYVLVLAFAVGIAIATIYSVAWPTIVWLLLLGFVIAVVSRRNSTIVAKSFLPVTTLFFVALALGILRTESHKEQFQYSPLDTQLGETTLFSGTVVREPDKRDRTTHLYVQHANEVVLVTVDRNSAVQYGDEVLVSGEVEKPESFETDLGRVFNYPGYLLARGVTHTVSYADVTTITSNQGNPLVAHLLKVKHELMRGIESVIPEPQAGLAEGLLLGVKQALGEDLELAFRQSGIIHIVVLSGYNVMLVVAFIMFFFTRLVGRKLRLLLGVAAIISFALLVGLSATVVRACIMASLFLFAETFAKQYSVFRALFFAGFVMILINPFLLLYDIGFQLSFMATLGLLIVAPQFESDTAKGRLFGVREYFIATIATQIAVLPLLLYHIGEISIVAVVVNVLVLPVVATAMLGAFVAGLIALVSTSLAAPFAYATSFVLSYIIFIATWFAALPLSTLIAPAFSPVFILVMYFGIGALLYLLKRRKSDIEEYVDWEVVEEETVLKQVVTKSAAPRTAPKDDTPIFFR